MSELNVETRSRSRSKTPFLRSMCDSENCGEEGHEHHHEKKKTSKTPVVKTITEEESSSTTGSHKKQIKSSSTTSTVVTAKTSDYYSSDDHSPNSSRDKIQMVVSTTTAPSSGVSSSGSSSKVTTSSNSVLITRTQKISRNSQMGSSSNELLTQTITSPINPIKTKESDQNQINSSAFEKTKIKTSTPIFSTSIESQKKKTLFTAADSSSTYTNNGDLSDHLAYQEYKEAGDYWNKHPKTDYTYSKLSPHRRELAKGEIGMPNMSRRSLEQHHDRVNEMIKKNPEQEDFIRRRYEQISYARMRKTRDHLAYDSQDEVDVVHVENNKRNKQSRFSNNVYTYESTESFLTRFVSRIVTIFYNFVGLFISSSDEEYLYSSRIREQKGFFSRCWSLVTGSIASVFRNIYLAISSVLYYDTCLLRTSSTDNRNKKRFLIFLLLLLPLLLLTAWNYLDEEERTHTYLYYLFNLIPLKALSLKDSFSKSPILPDLKASHIENMKINIDGHLGEKAYDNLLKHINVYIQKMVDEKTNDPTYHFHLTTALSGIISEKVRDKFTEVQSSTLNDEDINKIVEAVYLKIDKLNLEQKVNPLEISKMVKESMPPSPDLDVVIIKILNSPKLKEFVDERVLPLEKSIGTNSQMGLVVDKLTNDIELIKKILDQKNDENENLRMVIDNLKNGQLELIERFSTFDYVTNEQLAKMLIQIDEKINNLKENQFVTINLQIQKSLGDIFGYKHNVEKLDLENWIKSLFVAKELLEERLAELSKNTDAKIKEQIEHSGNILMQVISEKLKTEIFKLIKSKELNIESSKTVSMNEDEIRRIVKSVLAIYDADKTGLVDYALESAGGQILSTRCTENYQTKTAQISMFGIPLWYPSNTPRIAISPNVQPGECWAFQGFPGFLVLRLNSKVYVTGFTVEHIPKTLAPNGKIDSAPRNFTVWGLETEKDQEAVLFGEYEYSDSSSSLQYFPVQNKDVNRPYDIIELRIETNHGHLQYTCLYRFRVHGKSTN